MSDGRHLRLVGALTWLMVGVTSIGWQTARGLLTPPRGLLRIVCYARFLLFFLIRPRPECSPRGGLLLTALQSLAALGGMALMPIGGLQTQPVLLVIVA